MAIIEDIAQFNKQLFQHIALAIWYGSWVLIGITLGFLLSPSVTHGAEAITDNFDSYSAGSNLSGQGNWLATTSRCTGSAPQNLVSSDYYSYPIGFRIDNELTGTTTCSAQNLTEKTEVTVSYKLKVNDIYRTGYRNSTIGFYFTQNADGTGSATSYYIGTRIDSLTKWNLKFCTAGTTLNSGCTYDSGNLNLDEWYTITVRWSDTDSKVYVSLNGSAETVALSMSSTYSYLQTVFIQGGNNASQDIYDNFGMTDSSYVLDDSRILATEYDNVYDESITTADPFDVTLYLTEDDVATNPDDFELGGVCIPYPSWSSTDGTYNYNIIETPFVGVSGNQTVPVSFITGNTWPDIQQDKQYKCQLELRKDGFLWFNQSYATYAFSFYTFQSSTSPEAVAYSISQLGQAVNFNTTGTTTNPSESPFSACSYFSTQFNVADCLIAPVKFMFVPTEADFTDHRNNFVVLLNKSWPFSVFSEIGASMYENIIDYATSTATTTEVMPDLEFTMQDNRGATTTITIFSGTSFTQYWSGEEFGVIRDYLEALLYLIWIMWVFFRLRAILPTPESIATRV